MIRQQSLMVIRASWNSEYYDSKGTLFLALHLSTSKPDKFEVLLSQRFE